jgi:sporulation protein YlmC with PRC-barrel domain
MAMVERSLSGAALGLLFAATAMAQGAPPETAAQSQSASDFLQQQTNAEWRASNFMEAPVLGADNQRIGAINDLVVDQKGNVQAAVVGVGGFLGLGEKKVAIPFKNLTVVRTSDGRNIDHVTVTYTREQLKSAPEFRYADRGQ